LLFSLHAELYRFWMGKLHAGDDTQRLPRLRRTTSVHFLRCCC
jgi:hypothetical protein